MSKPCEDRERKRGIYCDRSTFVIPATKRDRVFSLPEVFQPFNTHTQTVNNCINKDPTNNRNILDNRNHVSEPSRRHSWSSPGTSYSSQLDICRPPSLSMSCARKSSHDSTRLGSSTHSITEIIEECSSDDEVLSEECTELPGTSSRESDFFRCRNCFQNDGTVLIVKSDKYPYCKKCRDLLRNKNKYGTMIPCGYQGLRKSTASPCGDLTPMTISTSPPRRCSRKASVGDVTDLPCIEEPSAGEEGTDTKELQLIVEREVHKLLNFGTTSSLSGTTNKKTGKSLFCRPSLSTNTFRSSDNDMNLITAGLTSVMIHKNFNPVK